MHRTRLLLVASLIACRGSGREPDPAPPPSELARSEPVVADEPRALVDQEGALVIPAVRTRSGEYELRFGKGRALLSLQAGTFVAPDPTSGAIALEVLTRWLGVRVPQSTHSRPLQPLTFDTIALGEGANKAFFASGAESAEMYINIIGDDRIAFLPKDPEYGSALADMFADALRDGPVPRRTMATDPQLETETPLFAIGREVDTHGGDRPACVPDGWIAFVADVASESVWHASWGRAPKRLCELPGAVDELAVAPRSGAVVATVTARDPKSGVIDTRDTATLWSVGPSGCRAIATPKDVAIGPFTFVTLSSSGTDLAFLDRSDLVTQGVGGDAAKRTGVGALDLIYAWDEDGVQLHDLEGRRTRVQPGGSPAAIDRHTTISPDGVYAVTLREAALDVQERASGTSKTFTPSFRSDVRAIERADDDEPGWLAPHSVILRGSPDVALDVATLRMRPLVDPAASVVCVSPDGARALLQRGDELFESK